MLHYELAATMPGLFVSNYIYGQGDRAEELAAENRIVHPAFMQRTLRALSA
jgi:prophage DNA circulation protein